MFLSLSQHVVGNLGAKLCLNTTQSNAIVQPLIPVVMKKLVAKTNDTSDFSFDLKAIVSSLGGNKNDSLDILGNLGSLLKYRIQIVKTLHTLSETKGKENFRSTLHTLSPL